MALTPSMLVPGTAEEMANYYAEVFPDGVVTDVMRAPGPDGELVVVTASILVNDTSILFVNGGSGQSFNESFSFVINCKDQEEVDYFWDRLVGDGGKEVACGWCTDRYGFSWQVVPVEMPELLQDSDPERAAKAMEAMMNMKKIDLEFMRNAMDS